jgi:hypothetical protein
MLPATPILGLLYIQLPQSLIQSNSSALSCIVSISTHDYRSLRKSTNARDADSFAERAFPQGLKNVTSLSRAC